MAVKKYNSTHYLNKLLIGEKTTIVIALKKTNGSIKKAHKILCPKGYPYTVNALQRVIAKHDLKLIDFK